MLGILYSHFFNHLFRYISVTRKPVFFFRFGRFASTCCICSAADVEMGTAIIGFTRSLVPTFQASRSRFSQWTLLSMRSVETSLPVRTSIWSVASHEKAISAFVSRDLPARLGPQLATYVWKAVVSHLGPCVWQQLLGDWQADPCESSCSLLWEASSCSIICTWRRWLSFVVAARWWSTRLHPSALTTRRSGESLFMLWQAWRYPMPNRFSSSNGDMVRQESNLPPSEAWILAPVWLQFSTSRLFRGWSDRRFSWWDSTSQIASGHRRPRNIRLAFVPRWFMQPLTGFVLEPDLKDGMSVFHLSSESENWSGSKIWRMLVFIILLPHFCPTISLLPLISEFGYVQCSVCPSTAWRHETRISWLLNEKKNW